MAHPTHQSIAVRCALYLRGSGPATVNEIAQTLELSRTSLESAMRTLMDIGLVVDAPTTAGRGAGRPARRYAFDGGSGHVVGVDIGVASVRVVVSDLAGRILRHDSFVGVAEYGDGASKLAAVIADVHRCIASASVPRSRIRAIGVSLPGIVDDAGRVSTSVVIPEWSGVDIGSQLEEAFGCPVAVDNGVRLAATAEHHLGVAQLVDDVLYLSVGNRIAMGLILGGRPRRGIHNAAGDIGRLAFRGLDASTGEIRWRSGSTGEEVFELARSGDTDAAREIADFIDELAHGIALLVLTVDPAMVVIGGGLSAASTQLLDPLRTALTTHIGVPFTIPVVGARLGAEAASHGAVVLAFHRHAGAVHGLDGMPVPRIKPLPHDIPAPNEPVSDHLRQH